MRALKQYLIGVVGALLAVLGLWGKRQADMRSLAERQRDAARSGEAASRKSSEITRRAREKADEARRNNAEATRVRHETDTHSRRAGRFGTADRLRDANRD